MQDAVWKIADNLARVADALERLVQFLEEQAEEEETE